MSRRDGEAARVIDLSSVDVVDMLDRLGMRGVRLTSGGREANFSCPFAGHAHGDERPSAYMNAETTAAWCFSCHWKGNAISFVADVQNVSVIDAQRWLRDTYGIDFVEPAGGSMVAELEARLRPRVETQPRTRPSKGHLTIVRADWHSNDPVREEWQWYMIKRGFAIDTLKSFDIGYDYWCKRITIPVFDLNGELVGIKGRSWRENHKPKYLILGDQGEDTRYGFHPYEASEVVFGLHRHRHLKIAVVFEGEFNAVACEQAMVEHGAHVARSTAIGMSYMSQRHAQLLAREVDEVYLFGDPDSAGEGFVRGHVDSRGLRQPGAVDLLEPLVSTFIVRGQEHDAAEYVRRGESSTIIELIRSARSSVATQFVSR
jgi:DNA primase